MFRKTAMVMTTLAALVLTADSALARGGHCGGGGCGSWSGCGAGGCGGGGCAAPACGSCAAAPAAPAKPCATCTGGSCAPAGKYAAAPTVAPAYISVSLPADAKLTIDGQATTSTSAARSFVTTSLEDGKQYSYTLQMQVVRDGKVQTVSQDVIVQAGKESKVTLTLPTEAVAAK